MYVKICGLKHPEHVVAAIEAGASGIGLVMCASVRQVSVDLAAQLLEGIPAHIERFAVFRVPEPDTLRAISALPFTALQADASYLGPIPKGWRHLPTYADGPQLVDSLEQRATSEHWLDGMVLVDGPGEAGAGVTGSWRRARQLASRGPLMLAGGLSPDNVARAIVEVRPAAVDVSSGVERARGDKDPERIAAFVRAARGIV